MGLFDKFFKKEAAPVDNTEERSITYPGISISTWADAFSGTDKYDRLSVVFGCVSLKSQTVGSLPVRVYRKTDGGHEEAKDNLYYNILARSPNGFQTSYDFWCWVVVQLELYGNAYFKRIKNGLGDTIEFLPLNPSRVQIDILADGTPQYTMDVPVAQPGGGVATQIMTYGPDDIIHIKNYSRNGVYGLSAVEAFRVLFDGYMELEQAGTQIAKNAAKPAGVVYYPPNIKEDELGKMRDSWSRGFNGGNSGKTAFLPNSLKVDKIENGLSANDAQYLENRKFTAQRIAADIFRVPAHLLNLGTNGGTYQNIEQSNMEFLTYTIQPLLTNIEQQLNKQLFGNDDTLYVKFKTNALLRGDINTRMNFYKFGLEHGVYTPNDIHRMEDDGIIIPASQGGDTYMRPLNFAAFNSGSAAS